MYMYLLNGNCGIFHLAGLKESTVIACIKQDRERAYY